MWGKLAHLSELENTIVAPLGSTLQVYTVPGKVPGLLYA